MDSLLLCNSTGSRYAAAPKPMQSAAPRRPAEADYSKYREELFEKPSVPGGGGASQKRHRCRIWFNNRVIAEGFHAFHLRAAQSSAWNQVKPRIAAAEKAYQAQLRGAGTAVPMAPVAVPEDETTAAPRRPPEADRTQYQEELLDKDWSGSKRHRCQIWFNGRVNAEGFHAFHLRVAQSNAWNQVDARIAAAENAYQAKLRQFEELELRRVSGGTATAPTEPTSVTPKTDISPPPSQRESGGGRGLQRPEVNTRGDRRAASLWTAAEDGQTEVTRELLAHGASVNQPNKNGVTPLWLASCNGHSATCEVLLAHRADVTQTNKNGATPLYMASQNGLTAMCKLLLAHGADVNQADRRDVTPLWVASQYGHTATCERLLGCGADVNLLNKNGLSPLWIASFNGHEATCERLLTHGADVNHSDPHEVTPLEAASYNGHTATCELLRRHGAVD